MFERMEQNFDLSSSRLSQYDHLAALGHNGKSLIPLCTQTSTLKIISVICQVWALF